MKTRSSGRLALMALDLVLMAPVFGAEKAGGLQNASCCGSALEATADPLTKGDVNCNGTVDLADALLILRSVSGLPVSAGCLPERGDVDCSGAIDGADALQILRHLAGKPALLPSDCPPIGGWTQTSEDKIEQALAAGKINSETALVYRVFATFDDSRLPAEYKGDDTNDQNDLVIAEVRARFSSLSASTQTTLQPFLRTPLAADSWFQLRANSGQATIRSDSPATTPPSLPRPLKSVDTSPNVRIWYQERYPEDLATAQSIAAEIDSVIWPKLTGLLGSPMSDLGLPDNGGDGRLDIYLMEIGFRSVVAPYGCEHGPVDVLLRRNPTPSVIAHELTHAVLFAYRVKIECHPKEYRWLQEATSQWMMDYIYPNANEERWGRECFLSNPELPLEFQDNCREYDAYLWNFFLARMFKSEKPVLIRDAWINAYQYDSLGAINQALAAAGLGGFKDQWPEFALYNYNRPPAPLNSYTDWDGIPFQAKVEEHNASSADTWIPLQGDVGHLSARYHRFRFIDPSIKSVIFAHPFADGDQPTAKVQALVKLKGPSAWKIERDWTQTALRRFCFAKPEENLEELVIIVSNSEYQDRTHVLKGTPVIGISPQPCSDFVGSFRYTYKKDLPAAQTSITETTRAVAFFKRDKPIPTGYDTWTATGGNVSWNLTGTLFGCRGAASAGFPVQPGDGTLTFVTSGSSTTYSGFGGTLYYYSLTYDCPPPEKDIVGDNMAMSSWFNTSGDGQPIAYQPQPDGSIKGSYASSAGGISQSWAWTLLPALP